MKTNYKDKKYAECIKTTEYKFEPELSSTGNIAKTSFELELYKTALYPNEYMTRRECMRRKPTAEEEEAFQEKVKKDPYVTRDSYVDSVVYYYCPECGTISKFEHPNWDNREQRERCPKCGFRYFTDQKYECGKPKKAIIYEMADGTKAISFVYEDLDLIVKRNKKTNEYHAFIKKSKSVTRIIFSKNGHTYYKYPVSIDTGKAGRLRKNSYRVRDAIASKLVPLRDITYLWSKSYKDDYDEYIEEPMYKLNLVYSMDRTTWLALKELKEKGIIDVQTEKLRHRFKNLNIYYNKALNMLYNNDNAKYLGMNIDLNSNYKRILAAVKPDMNDEQALNAILKKMKLEKCGKVLKKYFIDDPFYTTACYLIFKSAGFKDINNFYKFYEAITNKSGQKEYNLNNTIIDSIYVNNNRFADGKKDPTLNILKKYIKTCGENAVIKMLLENKNMQSYTIYEDTIRNIIKLVTDYNEEFNEFKPSIRKTHDAALAKVMAYKDKNGMERDAIKVNNIHEKIQKTRNEKERMKLIKEALEIIEPKINNDIKYTEEEKKLETTVDNIKFFLPKDTDSMLNAGERLHNCVGHNYRMIALHKLSTIVIMENQGKLTGCIEIFRNGIRQAYGPCNSALKPEEKNAFDKWVQTNREFIKYDNCKNNGGQEPEYFLDVKGYENKYERFMNACKTGKANYDDDLCPF